MCPQVSLSKSARTHALNFSKAILKCSSLLSLWVEKLLLMIIVIINTVYNHHKRSSWKPQHSLLWQFSTNVVPMPYLPMIKYCRENCYWANHNYWDESQFQVCFLVILNDYDNIIFMPYQVLFGKALGGILYICYN